MHKAPEDHNITWQVDQRHTHVGVTPTTRTPSGEIMVRRRHMLRSSACEVWVVVDADHVEAAVGRITRHKDAKPCTTIAG